MVRDVIDADAGLPCRAHDAAEVVEQSYFFRYLLHPGPELASLAQEVVVEIYTQHCCRFGVIRRVLAHVGAPLVLPATPAAAKDLGLNQSVSNVISTAI